MEGNYPWPQEAPLPKPEPLNNKLLERGREGKNEWWRYFVGIILSFLVGYQIIGAIPLSLLVVRGITNKYFSIGELLQDSSRMLDNEFLHVSTNVMLSVLMFIFVGAMGMLWVAVRFIHKKPFMAVISGVSNRFDFKRYFLAFGIWAALCTVQLVIALNMSPENFHYVFNPVPFFIGVVVLLIFLPIQTGWEEVFLRGYVMQGLGTWMKKSLWPWLITSAIFGLLHIMNTEVQENGVLLMLPQYILPGLVFGAMALMDQRLELPMGMHFAHNLFGLLTISSADSSIKSNTIWEISSISNSSDALFGAGFQIIAIGIFFCIYKWDLKKLYK